MSERISFGQVALAAVYASPLMALAMSAAGNDWPKEISPARLIGPLLVVALMFAVPAAACNLVARGFLGVLGEGMSGQQFHLAVGLVAGILLVVVINGVSQGSSQIGGGPLSPRSMLGLVIAAICNAGMIFAVWHFGWKSTYD